jgi:hypothetical protein
MTEAVQVGSLNQLATEANRHHAALGALIKETVRVGVDHILEAGCVLSEAKEQTRYKAGGWTGFADDHLSFSVHTANRYVFCFENQHLLQKLSSGEEFSPRGLERELKRLKAAEDFTTTWATEVETAQEEDTITSEQAADLKKTTRALHKALEASEMVPDEAERLIRGHILEAQKEKLASEVDEDDKRRTEAAKKIQQVKNEAERLLVDLRYVLKEYAEFLTGEDALAFGMVVMQLRDRLTEAYEQGQIRLPPEVGTDA